MDSLDISLMLFIIFAIAWLIITYKYGDWRNWRLFYPTILFFYSGNLIAFSIFHDNLLWEFKSNTLDHNWIDLIQMLVIFTCTTILFLQYYPKKLSKQIFYILIWVFIYSSVEWLFHLLGGIVYNQGWSIWWSVTHNIYQFILLRIHYKNPILAWILAILLLGIIMFIL